MVKSKSGEDNMSSALPLAGPSDKRICLFQMGASENSWRAASVIFIKVTNNTIAIAPIVS